MNFFPPAASDRAICGKIIYPLIQKQESHSASLRRGFSLLKQIDYTQHAVRSQEHNDPRCNHPAQDGK